LIIFNSCQQLDATFQRNWNSVCCSSTIYYVVPMYWTGYISHHFTKPSAMVHFHICLVDFNFLIAIMRTPKTVSFISRNHNRNARSRGIFWAIMEL
jgi:hypothetical protein